MSQSQRLKRIQIFVNCIRRILEALPMIPCSPRYNAGCEIQKVQHEFVRVLRPDPERRESLLRKVARSP